MAGPIKGNPRLLGRKSSAASIAITELIVLLHDRGLSYDAIVFRLAKDFDVQLSRSAVWQRYQRGKQI